MSTLSRLIKDELKLVRTSLPAASASANGASIDLENVPLVEDVHISLMIPALAALADTKTITAKIQDSADNVTFADHADLATLVVTGSGIAGSSASSKVQRIPLNTRRYVRAVYTAVAASGDVTASTGELALTF